MADAITEPYFRLCRSILKGLLLWPNDYKTALNKFIFIIGILNACSVFFFQICLEIYYIFLADDEFEISQTTGTVTYHIYATIKMFHWLFQMPCFTSLILMLQRSSFGFTKLYKDPADAEHIKGGNVTELNSFHKQKRNLKRKYVRIMSSARKRAMFLIYSYLIITVLGLLASYVPSLIIGPIFTKVDIHSLPYQTYRFFGVNNTEPFIMETILHCYLDTISIGITLGSDCCLIGIIIFLTAQTSIIGIILENIATNKVAPSELKYYQLQNCVDEKNIICLMVKKINRSCSNIILCQYVISTVFFCYYTTLLLKEQDIVKLVTFICFMIIFSTQLFLIAWFSQSFTEEFASLQYSIYNMNWLDTEPKFRKMLVFTIAKVQNPPSVNVGEFGPVNLMVFLLVVKTTYSFYTLLSKTAKG